MEPLQIESYSPREFNVHLRSLYREAEEFDVGPLVRKSITISTLLKLLLGQEPFVPSWLALDADVKDSTFWIETLTLLLARPNENICANVASFHDSLAEISQAVCISHARDHLLDNLNPNGHGESNQTPNINGKRPRSDTDVLSPERPRGASKSPRSSKSQKELGLPLKKWLRICDGTRPSLKSIHGEWNHMISKATKAVAWEKLENNWAPQGLALSLGYFANMTEKLVLRCASLISELSKGRPNPDSGPLPSYIPIVRGLGNLWPAAKNAEFECCIRDVVYGNFRPQGTEQLLGYILELARTIKGTTITVNLESQEAERKKAEKLCRRNARQLKEEQKEKEINHREEMCRLAEEDFGRDRLAFDDECASMDMASAKLREAQDQFDERERALAAKEASFAEREDELTAKEVSCNGRLDILTVKEASFAEREGELTAKEVSCKGRQDILTVKEASCIETGAITRQAVEELRRKWDIYDENRKLLIEGQRHVKEGKERHAKNMATIAKRDAASMEKENKLKESQKRVDAQDKSVTVHKAWIDKKWNAAIDREKACATKEAGFDAREEALCKGQAAVASERQELETAKLALKQEQIVVASERQEFETQKSTLKQEQTLHEEAKVALKAREEELSKEQALVASDKQGLEAEKAVFKKDAALHREGKKMLKEDNDKLAKVRATILSKQRDVAAARAALECEKLGLREAQAALSHMQEEAAAAGKAIEDEKLALIATQKALSRRKEEVKASEEALESERSKLSAKKALYEEEKSAWRRKMSISMQQMQEMHKTLSAW